MCDVITERLCHCLCQCNGLWSTKMSINVGPQARVFFWCWWCHQPMEVSRDTKLGWFKLMSSSTSIHYYSDQLWQGPTAPKKGVSWNATISSCSQIKYSKLLMSTRNPMPGLSSLSPVWVPLRRWAGSGGAHPLSCFPFLLSRVIKDKDIIRTATDISTISIEEEIQVKIPI